MTSVFGGSGRVPVFVIAVVVATAGAVTMPAAAHADTSVGCDTPGLVAAVNAANAAGSGTLDLTAGCVYKLTNVDPSGHGLPEISGDVRIHGNGATIERVATALPFVLIFVTGTLTMDHVTLTGGDYDFGGALANNGGTVTLTDSTISANTATGSGEGGGIYNDLGTLTLARSTIADNTVTDGLGGGIANVGGTLTLSGSTVSDNTSAIGRGGGIYNDGPTATLTNTTVSGNNADQDGGGIYNDFGSILNLVNSTVSTNMSGENGAEIYNFDATATVASSIISGTGAANCVSSGGSITSSGYNLDSDGTCGFRTTTDHNLLDPMLGPLQENGGPAETMAPASTSPVVDLIPKTTNGCGTTITTDQRGVARPQGSGCDIGAYETGDIAMQALAAKPKSVVSGAHVTYTATVVNAGPVDATGVTATDILPTGLKYISAKASSGGCSFTAPTLTCAIGQFPAATTARVTIVVKVTAAPGTTVSDTATVSATTGETMPGNDAKTAKLKVT